MKFTPLRGRAFIKLDEFELDFYGSGIARPQVAYDKPMIGEVLAIGKPNYAKRKGCFQDRSLSVGDKVMVPWATGHDLSADNRLYVICKFEDIIAKVEK